MCAKGTIRKRVVPFVLFSPMAKLSVNVNKVATLRNTRTLAIPSVTHAARLCLEAGAHGITVHPRPDERHIRRHDVFDVAAVVAEFPAAEYNIEGNPFHNLVDFARQTRPTQCTLVPDSIDALTSNQGWDLARDGERLRPIVDELHGYGCRVSLFMDAIPERIDLVPLTGADRIELYTEPYAAAHAAGRGDDAVAPFVRTAERARELGLGVNAGHDLSLQNLAFFLRHVPDVLEVSIGHALIADALELGLTETVRRYLAEVA
jgi:pyridoxine 5-phosphate synthase